MQLLGFLLCVAGLWLDHRTRRRPFAFIAGVGAGLWLSVFLVMALTGWPLEAYLF